METRFRITNFLGGLNEIARPDLISDNEVQEMLNYSIQEDGSIKLRPVVEPLGEEIDSEVGDIVKLFVWYPNILPEDSKKKHLLIVYDLDKQLWVLCYREIGEGDVWDSLYKVDQESKPLFTHYGIPFIANTQDKVMLVDGRDNNTVKYISINNDKKLMFGDIGIPAPVNIASMSSSESDNVFVSDDSADTGMMIRKGSIIFMAYTVVTEDGVESASSPVYVGTSQNIYTRDDDYNEIKYWQKTVFNHLRVRKDLIDQVKDRIEYFNVYLSYIPYSESEYARDVFRRALRIPIQSFDGDNTYVSTTPPTGKLLGQDSATDVKGDDICYTGGVTFISNANRSIRFPFNFDYYTQIDLTNNNNRNYVNANIFISIPFDLITKKVSGSEERIIKDKADLEAKIVSRNIRIYDQDMITPLMVTYRADDDDEMLLMVKVPYIPANMKHSIYLVLEGEGVPSGIGADGYIDGKFRDIESVVDDEQLDLGLVRSSQDLLVSSIKKTPVDKLINARDDNKNLVFGSLSDGVVVVPSGTEPLLKLDYLRKEGIKKTFGLNTPNIGTQSFGLVKYLEQSSGGYIVDITDVHPAMSAEKVASEFPSKGYIFFTYAGITTSKATIPCIRLKGSGNRYIDVSVCLSETPSSKHILTVATRNNNTPKTYTLDITAKGYLFGESMKVLVSWDKDEGKLNLYAKLKTEELLSLKEDIDGGDLPEYSNLDVEIYGAFNGNIEYYNTGGTKTDTDTYLDAVNTYSLFHLSQDVFIDDETDVEKVFNLLPYFPEERIGNDLDVNSSNNNVTIHPAKRIAYDTKPGMIQFSSLDGVSFPTLNYVRARDKINRIFPAPNYLKDGNYMNCVLIFGDDFRQRFLLSGSPDTWTANMNEILIDEKVFHGLSESSKETVQMIGDTLFWLSGDKLMMENIEGLRTANMEGGFDRVKIPYPKEGQRYLSFYDKINNKLHLCLTEQIEIPPDPSGVEESSWTAFVERKASVCTFTMKFDRNTTVKINWDDTPSSYEYVTFREGVEKTITHHYVGVSGEAEITFTSFDWQSLISLKGNGKITLLYLTKKFTALEEFIFAEIEELESVTVFDMPSIKHFDVHGCSIQATGDIDDIFIHSSVTSKMGGLIRTDGGDNSFITNTSLNARNFLESRGFTLNYNEAP
jgi:hypothetical protein